MLTKNEHRTQVAYRLTVARNKRKLTVDDVARKLHETVTTVRNHESGETTPNAYTLCQYADVYDVTLDWLCGRTNIRSI